MNNSKFNSLKLISSGILYKVLISRCIVFTLVSLFLSFVSVYDESQCDMIHGCWKSAVYAQSCMRERISIIQAQTASCCVVSAANCATKDASTVMASVCATFWRTQQHHSGGVPMLPNPATKCAHKPYQIMKSAGLILLAKGLREGWDGCGYFLLFLFLFFFFLLFTWGNHLNAVGIDKNFDINVA